MKRFYFFLLLSLTLFAEEGKLDWNGAKELRKGLKLIRLELTEPRLMKVSIIRLDLTLPGLHITGTERDADWGKEMPDCPGQIIRTKRERTADFMRRMRKSRNEGGRGLEMIVAANASPWVPWQKPFTHIYGDPVGLTIVDGVVVGDNNNGQNAIFVVWKNGKLDIMERVPKEQYEKILLAVSGFGICMKDGEERPDGPYEVPLMPRMVYGLSKKRHWLYLMTIDGRQKDWSLGATGADIKRIMKQAGAWDVIDMDGGGSATLCWWEKSKNAPVVVNRQSSGGYTRPTGMNIGFYIR